MWISFLSITIFLKKPTMNIQQEITILPIQPAAALIIVLSAQSPILEPNFHVTNNIIEQINAIDQKYGPKQHLLLLDNNVLNTPNLEALVDDLCAAGFGRGAKYVDPGAYNIVRCAIITGIVPVFSIKR